MVHTNSDSYTEHALTHAHTLNCHCDNYVSLTASGLDKNCVFLNIVFLLTIDGLTELHELTFFSALSFCKFGEIYKSGPFPLKTYQVNKREKNKIIAAKNLVLPTFVWKTDKTSIKSKIEYFELVMLSLQVSIDIA